MDVTQAVIRFHDLLNKGLTQKLGEIYDIVIEDMERQSKGLKG